MKLLQINGVVELPDGADTDEFIAAYCKLVEEHGGRFGGGFEDVTDLEKAHAHSRGNKKSLRGGRVCGCFHCLRIFAPTKINDWLSEDGGTALCPYCGSDSVIGEGAGHPIKKEFLTRMRNFWF